MLINLTNTPTLPTHCCVIGGTGFIGSYLVRQLVSTGRRVTVIGRSSKPSSSLPEEVTYLSNPYGERDFLLNALRGVDEIIDLAYATIPKTSFSDPIHDITGNLPEAVKVFQIAAESAIKKIIWVSSGGTVYGMNQTDLIEETHPTNPISPYGITKLAIEKYAFMYHAIQGLPVICVRPSNAFGECQKAFSGQGFIATAIASILSGKEITLFGRDGTTRDYIYIEDVASGILAALEKGKVGSTYNIGTGKGLNNRQILEMLEPMAQASGLLIKTNILPSRMFDVPLNVLDNRKLSSDTGWYPKVDVQLGLEKTWHWFYDQYLREGTVEKKEA